MRRRHKLWAALLTALAVQSAAGDNAWCRTAAMEKACSNCHTIHNSENYLPLVSVSQEALMNDTCVGCHTGDNLIAAERPAVLQASDPGYDNGPNPTHSTLAGGNFYWTTQVGQDLMGHNVDGIAAQTSRTAPGDSLFKTYDSTNPLTCAGVNGCHGDGTGSQVKSIWGSHHSNQAITGNSPPESYRFLNGVVGEEDPDWEYSLAAGDHNHYKGKRRISDANTAADKTISSSCVRCHSNFHNDDVGADTGTAGASFASPWLRHPVDIDIGGRGADYDYGPGGAYNVKTPLASETIPDPAPSTVDLAGPNGTAIITCITCHRAHGSPYKYILRWDYQNWPAGGENGCNHCHTTKN